jgi:hypothetical protein
MSGREGGWMGGSEREGRGLVGYGRRYGKRTSGGEARSRLGVGKGEWGGLEEAIPGFTPPPHTH